MILGKKGLKSIELEHITIVAIVAIVALFSLVFTINGFPNKISANEIYGKSIVAAGGSNSVVPSSGSSTSMQDFELKGSSRNIHIGQDFLEDGNIPLDLDGVYGLAINAKVNLPEEDSLIRVILVSGDTEYLVYEGYPRIDKKGDKELVKICEESCALDGIAVDSLKLQVVNAEIELKSIEVIDSYDKLDNFVKDKGIKAYMQEKKKEQDSYKINQINSKGLLFAAGETSVSRLSFNDKKRLFGVGKGIKIPNLQGFEYYVGGIFEYPEITIQGTTTTTSGSTGTSEPTLSSLPSYWDWRNRHGENWITPVKNQANCGSCWAFASTGAAEVLANLYYNQHINLDLSEQQMVSCVDSSGCDGAYPYAALDYMKNNGIVDEACMPYKAIDSRGCTASSCNSSNAISCSSVCSTPSQKIKIGGRVDYSSSTGEDGLKRMIIEKGAVSGGLYSWSHAMTLVGYGTLAGGETVYDGSVSGGYNKKITVTGDSPYVGSTYWLFKNSWGTWWGESGYLKVIVSSTSSIGWTHAAIGPVTSVVTNYDISCVDKDNDNFCNWGISTSKPASCDASCRSEKDCDDSNPSIGPFDTNYNCIYIDGCTETDSGKDHDTYGQVLGLMDSGVNYDTCLDTNTLRETYCLNTTGTSESYACPDLCKNGACVVASCSDSDGGMNPDVYGSITGTMVDDRANADSCSGNILYEVYCDGNIGYSTTLACNGTCQGGKCIEELQPTISITYPTEGAVISDRFITITSEATDTQKVEYYINDELKSITTSSPFKYKFLTKDYSGDTKITAKAINYVKSAEATVNIIIGSSNTRETKTECNDAKDNDGDGGCDYGGCKIRGKPLPKDSECTDAEDNSESS